MSARIAISAVVVNHDGRDFLDTCLASLHEALASAGAEAEAIVVDNDSHDGSRELVEERHPQARFLALPSNLGFAAAVNRGIEAARGDWILLLNNDATLEADAVRHLLETAEGGVRVGSVAAQMRFSGSSVINSAGISVDRLGIAYDRLLGTPAAASDGEPVEVFGASAGAALYSRSMLTDVGGFDESFFLYLEDVDLAWRARLNGWRCLYAPRAVAHHHHSGTSAHGSSFKHRHVGRNRIRTLAKNADSRQLRRYGLPMLGYDLAYVAFAAVRHGTLAPLLGRVEALGEWRSYRRRSARGRPVELAPIAGLRAALARNRTWTRHSHAADARPPGPLRTSAILHLPDVSGPANTLRPSLERLSRHGPLHVIAPARGWASRSYEDVADVSTLEYLPVTFPRRPSEIVRAARRLIRETRGFRRCLRAQRPDLVVIATTTLPAALIAARLERVPAIVRVAEIFDKGHVASRWRSASAWASARLHGSLADALVCSSVTIAEQFDGRSRTAIQTLYPGISTAYGEGDGARLRRRFGLEATRPLVAVVGNITPGRGQDLMIRAMPQILERCPGAHCVLAGAPHPRSLDVTFERALRDLATELGVGDSIAFTGVLEEVADLYDAADLLVNPARFNEPFGRAALEALMARCPVVSTRVGAVPEVLRDREDALLVRPGDPAAIAAAVTELAEDRERARELAEQGRSRVLAEFGEERVAKEFERIAFEVVGVAPERAPYPVGVTR